MEQPSRPLTDVERNSLLEACESLATAHATYAAQDPSKDELKQALDLVQSASRAIGISPLDTAFIGEVVEVFTQVCGCATPANGYRPTERQRSELAERLAGLRANLAEELQPADQTTPDE